MFSSYSEVLPRQNPSSLVPFGALLIFFEKKPPKVCGLKKKHYLCNRIWRNALWEQSLCGNSSVGRARPCQGRGREFESRLPLDVLDKCQRVSLLSPGGGIGRRARFRCVCRDTCRFESCSWHYLYSRRIMMERWRNW